MRRIMTGLFGRRAIHRLSVVVMGVCLFFALFGVVAAQDSETAVSRSHPSAHSRTRFRWHHHIRDI